ncbi:MAG: ABC transporter substrate-binding protein [Hyphomicrobiales bacterium]|nr:ABC transporter substrate-binding protein [Hyphomicrobiales bacterium]
MIAIKRLTGAALMLGWGLMLVVGASAQAEPKRVVALGGEITEIVYQLGAQDQLVGRDTTSTYPEAANELPDVGYFRQLGAEGILSLKPDLILATAAAGPPEVLEQIASTGVQVEKLPSEHSAESLLEKVARIAKVLEIPEAGDKLASSLRQQLDEASASIAAMGDKPKVLFIIGTGGGDVMAAGEETAANSLIKLAGAENVFADHKGYKTMSLESAAVAAPDAIALMEHTLKAMGGVDKIADHPALKLTPAAQTQRIVARDGTYLLSFGPRLPEAMTDFAKAIRTEGRSSH